MRIRGRSQRENTCLTHKKNPRKTIRDHNEERSREESFPTNALRQGRHIREKKKMIKDEKVSNIR